MIYVCNTHHPRLTLGKTYVEWCPYPNQFNAVVQNDLGGYEHFPRKHYFTIIKDESE